VLSSLIFKVHSCSWGGSTAGSVRALGALG
jgi:hypothetical protein